MRTPEEVTNAYYNFLQELYYMTNKIGFNYANIRELIRKYKLSNNCTQTYLSDFIIPREGWPHYFSWKRKDVMPTMRDANIIRQGLNSYQNNKRKHRKHHTKQTSLFSSTSIKKVSIKEFSDAQLLGELKERGYKGRFFPPEKPIDL
jgi:hypothetical protein